MWTRHVERWPRSSPPVYESRPWHRRVGPRSQTRAVSQGVCSIPRRVEEIAKLGGRLLRTMRGSQEASSMRRSVDADPSSAVYK